jgi:hypothetical protein
MKSFLSDHHDEESFGIKVISSNARTKHQKTKTMTMIPSTLSYATAAANNSGIGCGIGA